MKSRLVPRPGRKRKNKSRTSRYQAGSAPGDQAIVFVGSTIRPEDVPKFPAASVAGNRYQYSLAAACAKLERVRVSVLAAAPIQMWKPGSDSPYVIPHVREEWEGGALVSERPAVANVILLKQATIAIGLVRSLYRWAHADGCARSRSIIVYNAASFFVVPAKIASVLTDSQLVIILADVPNAGLDARKGLLERADHWLWLKLLRASDALVVLTGPAAADLCGSTPSLILESGVDRDSTTASPYSPTESTNLGTHPKRIVHAGFLGYLSGIQVLLEAIEHSIKADVQLHLYGHGPLVPIVEEVAARAPGRVIYHGRVTHDEAVKAELAADLLVCPRIPDGTVTPYMFPSKVYEYMSTGVPTMCNRLESLPNRILPFLNLPNDSSSAAWSEAIEEFFAGDEDRHWQKSAAGRTYLQEHKTWDQQAERLMDFLNREAQPRNGLGISQG